MSVNGGMQIAWIYFMASRAWGWRCGISVPAASASHVSGVWTFAGVELVRAVGSHGSCSGVLLSIAEVFFGAASLGRSARW